MMNKMASAEPVNFCFPVLYWSI